MGTAPDQLKVTNHPCRVTENLLRLDDGDELVLANTRRGGLLYFAEGREFVLGVLKGAVTGKGNGNHGATENTEKGRTGQDGARDDKELDRSLGEGDPVAASSLLAGASDERKLLRALKAHRVLVPVDATEAPERPVAQDPTAPKQQTTLHLFVGGTNGDASMPPEVAQAATERTLRSQSSNGTCEIVFLGLNGDGDRWQFAWDTIETIEKRRKKQRRQRPGYVVATESSNLPDAVLGRAKDLEAQIAFDWAEETLGSAEARRTLDELAERDMPATLRLRVTEKDAADTSWAIALITNLPPHQSVELLPQSPNRLPLRSSPISFSAHMKPLATPTSVSVQ